ncbi:hypothetical protein KEM56_007202 [Ascosphaera pollenicola]|nr:hypothetical protein KEM56_007202 [Ascosphaera pollenicola]
MSQASLLPNREQAMPDYSINRPTSIFEAFCNRATYYRSYLVGSGDDQDVDEHRPRPTFIAWVIFIGGAFAFYFVLDLCVLGLKIVVPVLSEKLLLLHTSHPLGFFWGLAFVVTCLLVNAQVAIHQDLLRLTKVEKIGRYNERKI